MAESRLEMDGEDKERFIENLTKELDSLSRNLFGAGSAPQEIEDIKALLRSGKVDLGKFSGMDWKDVSGYVRHLYATANPMNTLAAELNKRDMKLSPDELSEIQSAFEQTVVYRSKDPIPKQEQKNLESTISNILTPEQNRLLWTVGNILLPLGENVFFAPEEKGYQRDYRTLDPFELIRICAVERSAHSVLPHVIALEVGEHADFAMYVLEKMIDLEPEECAIRVRAASYIPTPTSSDEELVAEAKESIADYLLRMESRYLEEIWRFFPSMDRNNLADLRAALLPDEYGFLLAFISDNIRDHVPEESQEQAYDAVWKVSRRWGHDKGVLGSFVRARDKMGLNPLELAGYMSSETFDTICRKVDRTSEENIAIALQYLVRGKLQEQECPGGALYEALDALDHMFEGEIALADSFSLDMNLCANSYLPWPKRDMIVTRSNDEALQVYRDRLANTKFDDIFCRLLEKYMPDIDFRGFATLLDAFEGEHIVGMIRGLDYLLQKQGEHLELEGEVRGEDIGDILVYKGPVVEQAEQVTATGNRFAVQDVLELIQSVQLLSSEQTGFTIIKRLGRGGFKEAFLAIDDTGLECVVARYIPDTRNVEYISNGSMELDAIRLADRISNPLRMNHPNLRPEFTLPGMPEWVVQRYYDNTLAEEVEYDFRKNGAMERNKVLLIAEQLLRGLDYLHHDQHIIHGDLGPKNIGLANLSGDYGDMFGDLNRMNASDDHVMICDFGCARRSYEEAEDTRRLLGSRAIRAPEVYDGGTPQYPADYWAFGCDLYLMLKGHMPFDIDEKNDSSVIDQIKEQYDNMQESLADVDDSLSQIVLDCLTVDPNERKERVGSPSVLLERVKEIGGNPEARITRENAQLREQLEQYKARFGELDG